MCSNAQSDCVGYLQFIWTQILVQGTSNWMKKYELVKQITEWTHRDIIRAKGRLKGRYRVLTSKIKTIRI